MKKEGKMSDYAEIKRSHDEGWITDHEYTVVHVLIDIIEKQREAMGILGHHIDHAENCPAITKGQKCQCGYTTAMIIYNEALKLTEE